MFPFVGGFGNPTGADAYRIARSLRFRASNSAKLTRTVTTSATFTFSTWVKRGLLGVISPLLSTSIQFNVNDTLTAFGLTTTAVFRDTSAWYHIHVSNNGLYVNGVSYGAVTTSALTNPVIGFNATQYFDGYLAETVLVDGTSVAASSFGAADAVTGVWGPKAFVLTYGAKGFYLTYGDNSSTANLGNDSSGNGNTWTTAGVSITAGVTNDSLVDTPTNYGTDTGVGGEVRGNYCTLNPLDKDTVRGTLSNGNLSLTNVFSTTNYATIRGTISVTSGKWLLEGANITTAGTGNVAGIGFTSSTAQLTGTGYGTADLYGATPAVNSNYAALASDGVTILFASYASGDIIQVAIDVDAGKYWVGKNGVWYNSGSPSAGTNPTGTFTAGTPVAPWFMTAANSGNTNISSITANFGQRPFAYAAPTGFKALCTQNLPTPAIAKPSSYFDVVTYTGSASTVTKTGLGFRPDLLWFKDRTNAQNHKLVDSVRGVTVGLSSNSSAAETADSVVTINSDGFSLATANRAYSDTNADSYVGWLWQKGAVPGFDIVTYTGTGLAGQNIAHALGAVPAFFIVKARNAVTYDADYHKSVGNGSAVHLGTTGTADASVLYFNNTTPTSSVFTVGAGTPTGLNGTTYVAYLFAEVPGFSRFGSYTGNNSVDGSFVYCGFRPKFFMVKRTDTTGSWWMLDAARSIYNPEGAIVRADNTTVESSTVFLDFTANGVKLRSVDTDFNASSGTYIFAAFAETPFKTARAR